MTTPDLRGIDLNLLVILNILLEERGVSRAAQRLHLTPSAVSHALNRLRALLHDELLIRDGRRMTPTTRALELSETLPRALKQLASALTPAEPFNPMESERTFRLAAPDFVASLIFSEISKQAPRVRVEWVLPSTSAVYELTSGHYDALVTAGTLKSEGVRDTPIGTCGWSVYGRSGHPAFKEWSTLSWCSYPHLQIGTSAVRGRGPIDQKISDLGLTRRVGAVIPYFAMAPSILTETDMLLTVPSMSMKNDQHTAQLERREVPFALPPIQLSVFRSAINGDEPGVRWFVERIESACRRLI